MARPVYSALLFRAPGFTGGPTVQYINPMTFRTVVKTISIVWGDILVTGLDAWVQTQDLTKLARTTRLGTPPPDVAGGTMVYFGDWVLGPGDTLSSQTTSGTCDFYVSGYQLSLP